MKPPKLLCLSPPRQITFSCIVLMSTLTDLVIKCFGPTDMMHCSTAFTLGITCLVPLGFKISILCLHQTSFIMLRLILPGRQFPQCLTLRQQRLISHFTFSLTLLNQEWLPIISFKQNLRVKENSMFDTHDVFSTSEAIPGKIFINL